MLTKDSDSVSRLQELQQKKPWAFHTQPHFVPTGIDLQSWQCRNSTSGSANANRADSTLWHLACGESPNAKVIGWKRMKYCNGTDQADLWRLNRPLNKGALTPCRVGCSAGMLKIPCHMPVCQYTPLARTPSPAQRYSPRQLCRLHVSRL